MSTNELRKISVAFGCYVLLIAVTFIAVILENVALSLLFIISGVLVSSGVLFEMIYERALDNQ